MEHKKGDCIDCGSCSAFPYSFLKDLSDLEIEGVKKAKTVKKFAVGEYVLEAGDIPKALFCVERGKAQAEFLDSAGNTFIVQNYNPGFLLGLPFFLQKAEMPWGIKVVEPVTVCVLNMDIVEKFLETSLPFNRNISTELSLVLKRIINRFLKIRGSSALDRLKEIMMQFSDKSGFIHLSRKEISEWAGITVETTVRLLSELEKEKIIKKDKSKIQVIDYELLQDYKRVKA